MEGERERPLPLRDLDWEPARARAFGEEILATWEELLERLPDLPVARPDGVEEVRAAVARPVPDEPLPREELVAYLRDLALRWSMYTGHPGFMGYITGAGTVPGAAVCTCRGGSVRRRRDRDPWIQVTSRSSGTRSDSMPPLCCVP